MKQRSRLSSDKTELKSRESNNKSVKTHIIVVPSGTEAPLMGITNVAN